MAAGSPGRAGRILVAAAVVAELLAAVGGLATDLSASGTEAVSAVHVGSPAVSGGGSSSSSSTRPSGGRGTAAAPGPAGGSPLWGPVSCQTDLSLAAAPDTGYDFLCTQGGNPVAWDDGRIAIYESGLTPVQSAAFATAVAQWSRSADFEVTYVSSPSDAQLTVTSAPLGAAAPGYVEDGYTTVSYRCLPRCAYYGARVELSSIATLTRTDWVSTILHELGHVAGLNHVSKLGEVMYPYLSADPPVAYQPGDLRGLAVLAAQRGA